MTDLLNRPPREMEKVRRRQIISAVVECVAEEGFEGATLRNVAARAGASTGMVTYYFRNKEELLEATLAAAAQELGEHVNQLVGYEFGLERLEKAAELVLVRPQESGFPPIGFWLSFWAAASRKEDLQHLFLQALLRNAESYRRSIEAAGQKSQRSVDIERAVKMLAALIRGLRIDSGLASETISPEEALELYKYSLGLIFGAAAVDPGTDGGRAQTTAGTDTRKKRYGRRQKPS